MACNNYFRAWILGCCGLQSSEDACASLEPRVPKALIRRAAVTNIRRNKGKVPISKEVANGFGATESKDCQVPRGINCNVPSHICKKGAVTNIFSMLAAQCNGMTPHLSNSYTVVTSSASTNGQLPTGHVSLEFVVEPLVLPGQEEAAANCSKSTRLL